MIGGIGKYLRHGVAILIGAVFTWLLNAAPWITTYATPEQLGTAQEVIVGFVTWLGLIAFGLAYAWAEKFLKRFRALDPEGAADRNAIKVAAEEQYHV